MRSGCCESCSRRGLALRDFGPAAEEGGSYATVELDECLMPYGTCCL